MNRAGRRGLRAVAAGATSVAALLLSGCGLQPATAFTPEVGPGTISRIAELPPGARLTVTSKNFTEQLVLGKIAVLAAKAAGFEVTDLTNAPGSTAARQLMLDRTADLTYEYTGTAWLVYLGGRGALADPAAQYSAVRRADAAKGLTWLPPAPLNNTYAFAVRERAIAELDGVSSLSQLKELPVSQRTFCVEAEFNSRVDGFKPMLQHYGLELGADDGVPLQNVHVLDTGVVYTATERGRCNFGEVFTTDGRIDALRLTALDDDRGFFPSYRAAPVINTETLRRHPQLARVFDTISPKLTDAELRKLNLRVDLEGEEPANVAFDWMKRQGFITSP